MIVVHTVTVVMLYSIHSTITPRTILESWPQRPVKNNKYKDATSFKTHFHFTFFPVTSKCPSGLPGLLNVCKKYPSTVGTHDF